MSGIEVKFFDRQIFQSSQVYHTVNPNKSYKNGYGCIQSNDVKWQAMYHTFVVSYGSTWYPSFTTIIMSLLLLIKVVSITKSRSKLMAKISDESGKSRETRKEVRSCIAVIGLAVMHFMVYFPAYLFWSGLNLLDVEVSIKTSILAVGRLLLGATILGHFWNLYAYYLLNTEFRTEINRMICAARSNSARSAAASSMSTAVHDHD